MKAVICAAGQGKRLMPLTSDRPKPLVVVGEKTIIEHLLDSLSECNLTDVLIVVGYNSDKVKDLLGNSYMNCNITYIDNDDYANNNNIYSVWMAKDHVDNGMVFFNGDIIFDSNVLKTLLDSEHETAIAVDTEVELIDDSMKISLKDNMLHQIGKKVESEAHGWAMGIYKLGKEDSQRYFDTASTMFAEDQQNERISFVVPLQKLADEISFHAVAIDPHPWVEIDDHTDLGIAHERIDNIIS